jgi:peptide/nickel transport system substrate-binding protein
MTRNPLTRALGVLATAGLIVLTRSADAAPQHGIAMYGDPALPPDFVSLPYANPEAPKGGRVVFGEGGGFDSLNPWILKGRAPWGLRVHVYESLLGRNWGEAFSLYGLLAESVETGPNREWVEFTLRPEARFSNGSPVTVEDVIWSFTTLAEKGHPRYANAWQKVAKWEQTGDRSVRFTFSENDRELPLILGLRPILRKADWEGRDFGESSMEVPTGSGPYIVGDFEANRFISFTRNPDYWGRDLPFNRGQNNLDEIRYDYFADASVIFEAFVAGELSVYRESAAQKWKDAYDFPAVTRGDIVKSLIAHQRPSGMYGFVMNTRRPIFADWRVREALIHAFNFEFINQVVNAGVLPRITSYFANSELGMDHGPAEGKVKDLLLPFEADLPPGAIDGYDLPSSGGDERNRRNLRKAAALLGEAGWKVGSDGVLRDAEGQAFTFEIMLKPSDGEAEANLYADTLKRLGIVATVTLVDDAQHLARRNTYDFDMMLNRWGLSLSPGNEQTLYWGSAGRTNEGTRNYMGVASPAIDAMIDRILSSETQVDFVTATRALDRVLTTGRYVIPFWYDDTSRLAHRKELHHPDVLPIYGDWLGFLPEVWWWQE